MSNTKIVKNTIGTDIVLKNAGVTLAASSSFTIDTSEYDLWGSPEVYGEVTPYINNGTFVINNGTYDLTIAEALVYLKYDNLSETMLFNNRSNGFTSITAQGAIEEAKNTVITFPRIAMSRYYNGVSGNNDWLGPSELLPNTPFIVVPFAFKIKDISWSNQNTGVDFHIEFRTGSKTGPIIYTLTVSNGGLFGYVSDLDINLGIGTAIYAQYKDDGQNCSDFELTLWITRVV